MFVEWAIVSKPLDSVAIILQNLFDYNARLAPPSDHQHTRIMTHGIHESYIKIRHPFICSHIKSKSHSRFHKTERGMHSVRLVTMRCLPDLKHNGSMENFHSAGLSSKNVVLLMRSVILSIYTQSDEREISICVNVVDRLNMAIFVSTGSATLKNWNAF